MVVTLKRALDRLEARWVTPSYSGWLLSCLAIFFFIAATNTLSGWLYVMSGVMFALLGIAAILPRRNLQGLRISRPAIAPVSVGDPINVELIVENPTGRSVLLLEVVDEIPMGTHPKVAIDQIPAKQQWIWRYTYGMDRRGVYRWQGVRLWTAAPLGLFSCRQTQSVPAKVIVYPNVLSLSHCPLVDELGQQDAQTTLSDRRTQAATQGLTRSLRPYRWGDPTRLVHWRSSARYGELRVRELELMTGGQDLVIGLDSALPWRSSLTAYTLFPEAFEQAVVAAASLYFYAVHQQLSVKLWTAGTGLIQGNTTVLEALAQARAGEEAQSTPVPNQPMVWLTADPASLSNLPTGSRWILWPQGDRATPPPLSGAGLVISDDRPLEMQLQSPLR